MNNAGHLNPTLSVQASFMVPVDGDIRRTQFALRDHPEVAVWLLTFLNYLLSKQGKLSGEWRIAEPPDGETRQALIDGGVILAQQRSDGTLGLTLNSNMHLALQIWVRRRGEPALDTVVALGADTDLARWLLTHYINGEPQVAAARLGDAPVASLRRYSILVDELPADEVYFPDPDAPVDMVEELAPMSRVFFQRAGQGIPAEVRAILGDQAPVLPPDTGIIWGQDAGTGMVYPICWNESDSPQDLARITGTSAVERTAQWDQQRETARMSLQSSNYAVLREILPPAQRIKVRHYVRQLIERGYFPDLGVGDTQVKLRRSIHKEKTIAALHNGLARLVSSLCNQPLVGSFCQLGVYEAGAVLEKHTDRSQCVRNLSFILDMSGPEGDPEPWPLYFDVDGQPAEVLLQIGDGAIYCGTETVHWRNALPARQRAVAGFFFFVPPEFQGTFN
ncbi:MAG: hypothetical protein ABI661_06770 [Gammaproteobacteria bacterium]